MSAAPGLPADREGPVTATVTRWVKPGHEPASAQFLGGVIAAASRVPGHRGAEVLRPQTAAAGPYRVVGRLDSAAHLQGWGASCEQAAWLGRAEPHALGPPQRQVLTFAGGGDSRLVVTPSPTGTAEAATKASWRVEDLAGDVAELPAGGVQLQDLPELGTVDGIADLGFALAAWFIDPDHHWVGLLQRNDPGMGPGGAAPAAGGS